MDRAEAMAKLAASAAPPPPEAGAAESAMAEDKRRLEECLRGTCCKRTGAAAFDSIHVPRQPAVIHFGEMCCQEEQSALDLVYLTPGARCPNGTIIPNAPVNLFHEGKDE